MPDCLSSAFQQSLLLVIEKPNDFKVCDKKYFPCDKLFNQSIAMQICPSFFSRPICCKSLNQIFFIFSKIILENGGAVLAGSGVQTVSQTISHEVFEMLADLRANSWWSDYSGSTFYAAEVCDPVVSNIVPVNVGTILVHMSDWVLPAWSDPLATTGPFNRLNTLTNPMSVDKGGYLITQTNGSINIVRGFKISSFTIANMCSRSIKRYNK